MLTPDTRAKLPGMIDPGIAAENLLDVGPDVGVPALKFAETCKIVRAGVLVKTPFSPPLGLSRSEAFSERSVATRQKRSSWLDRARHPAWNGG